MKKPFNHAMVDIESVDKLPTSGILSIGCVLFNDKGLCNEKFYLAVKIESNITYGLTFSESTMAFWRKQKPEAQAVFFDKSAVDLKIALQAYKNYLYRHGSSRSNLKVWSCGASFDIPILNNAFSIVGIEPPQMFWNESCYRTIKNIWKNVEIKREGASASHHALQDAIEQAEHLIEINKQSGGVIL